MPAIVLRPARPGDAPSIAACVCAAYLDYIERIGMQPAPMLEDYAEIVRQSQVHVAVAGNTVSGAIVLKITDEGFYLDDNVAVRPSVKGKGVNGYPRVLFRMTLL